MNLYILQIIIEDPALAKRLCSEESKTPVRLCRQRQPYLPVVRTDRVLAAYILDTMVDGINHNLRRRLDTEFYMYGARIKFKRRTIANALQSVHRGHITDSIFLGQISGQIR